MVLRSVSMVRHCTVQYFGASAVLPELVSLVSVLFFLVGVFPTIESAKKVVQWETETPLIHSFCHTKTLEFISLYYFVRLAQRTALRTFKLVPAEQHEDSLRMTITSEVFEL